jgi:hypothetical protein
LRRTNNGAQALNGCGRLHSVPASGRTVRPQRKELWSMVSIKVRIAIGADARKP